jgi:hypothetical protein
MSIYLRVQSLSDMDLKLEEEWGYEGDARLLEEWGYGYEGDARLLHESWIEFVKGLQFVKDCRYDHLCNETVIEFSNEASKTWFLMRWS